MKSCSAPKMAQEDVAAEKGASAEQLSAIEKVLVSQQKWTKLIATLLVLVTLLLTIITAVLLQHLLMGRYDAASAAAVRMTSTTSRVRRASDAQDAQAESSAWWYTGADTGLQAQTETATESVAAEIPPSPESPSSPQSAQSSIANILNEAENKSRNDIGKGDSQLAASGLEREMASSLKTIVQIGNNISATLDVIIDRFSAIDYRQPNFSCPNWNRGNYQFIGPDGYYSTCYYVQPNV